MKTNRIFLSFLLLAALLVSSALPGGVVPVGQAETAAVSAQLGQSNVTVVGPDTDLRRPIAAGTEETYEPASRQWAGCPAVVHHDGKLFVSFMTGAPGEPNRDCYAVIAVSDDGGRTWVDPLIIVDPVDESVYAANITLYINARNELWAWYPYGNWYANAFQIRNTGGAIGEITVSEEHKSSEYRSFAKPTVLTDGSILFAGQNTDGIYRSTPILKSADHGYSFAQIGAAVSTSSYKRHTGESMIVEKTDGSLELYGRLEGGSGGGVDKAVSYDGGRSWSPLTGDLGAPLIGPGSRFYIGRLRSGAWIYVTNASSSARANLTVYLSDDEGQTWSHALPLNADTTSYPDVTEDDDGNIYIAYDHDRYLYGAIRVCKLTEDDIRQGKFLSGTHDKQIVVFKRNGTDIVGTDAAYPAYLRVDTGTALAAVLAQLPAAFAVRLDDGRNLPLTGEWKCTNYRADVQRDYIFTYEYTEKLPAGVIDPFEYLQVTVTVRDPAVNGGRDGGCKSAAAGAGIGMLLSILGLAAACKMVRKRKTEERT